MRTLRIIAYSKDYFAQLNDPSFHSNYATAEVGMNSMARS
jgi:hypothetical protein